MNIIYETTKERGATILMPSSMVDSLNPTAATLGFALAGNDTLTEKVQPVIAGASLRKTIPPAQSDGAFETPVAKAAAAT